MAELAGVLGIDPAPFGLRQLVRMAEARQRAEWDRTATLAALIINVNRGKNSKAVSALELNPYRAPVRRPVKLTAAQSMEILKKAFVDRQLPDNIGE